MTPGSFTRADLLACLDRELAFRERVFARRVAAGTMSAAESIRERALMQAVRAVVAEALPPAQGELFAAGGSRC